MASIIRIKRSETAGNPSTLGTGELAYSALADNGSNGGDRLYIGIGAETNGNAVNHIVIGGKYFTDQINAATSSNTFGTLVRRDASGNISVTNLLGNASTANAWTTARNLALTGDATGTLTGVDGSQNVSAALTLATVNSNVGSFGGSTAIPVITVNAKGLITAVSTANISTALTITDGTTSDSLALGTDTLTFEAGTGVTTTVSNNKVSFAIGQAVNTTSNVTFNNVTVNGTLNSDDVTAANLTLSGNAVIVGNLTVQGTTTTVNSTTVAVGDLNITLAKDATTAAEADGGGITIGGANATFAYSAVSDRWTLNKNLEVTTVYASLVGNADTATKLQTARSIALTGDATATFSSFDGSANVSTAITLATVNSNTGSFGSGTSVPAITVNAKGLITAVSETAIPTATTSVLGLAKFDTNNFSVTGGLVSVSAIDGGTY